jgi:hypothetical protein
LLVLVAQALAVLAQLMHELARFVGGEGVRMLRWIVHELSTRLRRVTLLLRM